MKPPSKLTAGQWFLELASMPVGQSIVTRNGVIKKTSARVFSIIPNQSRINSVRSGILDEFFTDK